MQPFAPPRAADQHHKEKANELRSSMVRLLDALSSELRQMKELDNFDNKIVHSHGQTHTVTKRFLKGAGSFNAFRLMRKDVKRFPVLDSAIKTAKATYLLQSRLGPPLRQVILIPAQFAPSSQSEDLHFRPQQTVGHDDALHILAQNLVDTTPIRRLDPLVEKLQARTVQAVLSGTAWHPAKAVGARADPNAGNLHALASRLLKERRVFAIERAGVKEYPDYAFDPLGNPIPAMRDVLGALTGYSPFRLASWFESTNAHLGGRRPREVLGTDPQAVIAAARAHAEGPMHG